MTIEDDTLRRLISLHDQQIPRLRQYDAYYEGEQPLSYMHPELIQQLEGQVRQVVINWPQLVVDSVEERLNIEGFRRPDQPSGDKKLWEIWQDNDMDAGSQRAHVEALAMRRSYVTVGSPKSKDDAPIITDESALDVFATSDPATRETEAAVRRWCSDGSDETARADKATLYLPNATIMYDKAADGAWVAGPRDDHNLGAVPVVPILNRTRRKRPYGVSELELVLSLSDAACKIATDMMVGANFTALPRYYATGVTESDFTDENGNAISVWQAITGRIFASENENAKMGNFPASDLSNFHKTLTSLAQLVSSLCGLPPHYLGFSTDNPASAEGIKSSEARLNLRAERKQGAFDVSWEQVMRLAVRIQTGKWDKGLRRLTTAWRDPSTPTVGQVYDAGVKAYTAGIIPLKYTRRLLRYTDAEITQMEAMDDEAAAKQPAVRIAAALTGAGQPEPQPEPQPVPTGAAA